MGFRASSVALLFLLGCQGSAPPEETRAAFEAVEQCPVQSVEGVDVFDGQGLVDWNAVARAGIQFAFIKATQGTYDTQATFSFNWSQARAAGVLRSAYHFFDPTEDGAAQAGHFLATVGEMDVSDLPPMLDIECPDGDPNCLYSGASGAASAAEIATRLWAFLRAVEQATGKMPVVYTFGAYLEETGVSTAGLSIYPLALAFPSDAPCVSAPAPWAQATFWQYSWEGSVDGISGPVDRDRFLGALGDLQAWAGASKDASAPNPMVAPASSASPSACPSPSTPSSAPFSGENVADAAMSPPAATRAAGCHFACSSRSAPVPTALALASVLLVRKRRRTVARGGLRVLAGRTPTPCRRRIFARA